MTRQELRRLIAEVEKWHRVRSRLNKDPRRKSLQMDTLPKVIVALKAYEQVLAVDAGHLGTRVLP